MRDISCQIGNRTFWLRSWGVSPIAMLRRLWYGACQFWRSRYYWDCCAEAWTRTQTNTNARCYCPVGSITEFRAAWLGCGFWFEVQRGGPETPCHCDKIIWLLFPDGYQDEIEEYGLERLKAEYPGVVP
jgi:hypothetical protein